MAKNRYPAIKNFIKITSLCSVAIAINHCSNDVISDKISGFMLGLISIYSYGAAEHSSDMIGDYINPDSHA